MASKASCNSVLLVANIVLSMQAKTNGVDASTTIWVRARVTLQGIGSLTHEITCSVVECAYSWIADEAVQIWIVVFWNNLAAILIVLLAKEKKGKKQRGDLRTCQCGNSFSR